MKTLIVLLLIGFSTNVLAWGGRQYDRSILIQNASSYVIMEIRASNVGRSSYGRDRLGTNVLAPGEQGVLDLDDGTDHCLYDLRIITENNVILDKRNVDACTISVYTIYD